MEELKLSLNALVEKVSPENQQSFIDILAEIEQIEAFGKRAAILDALVLASALLKNIQTTLSQPDIFKGLDAVFILNFLGVCENEMQTRQVQLKELGWVTKKGVNIALSSPKNVKKLTLNNIKTDICAVLSVLSNLTRQYQVLALEQAETKAPIPTLPQQTKKEAQTFGQKVKGAAHFMAKRKREAMQKITRTHGAKPSNEVSGSLTHHEEEKAPRNLTQRVESGAHFFAKRGREVKQKIKGALGKKSSHEASQPTELGEKKKAGRTFVQRVEEAAHFLAGKRKPALQDENNRGVKKVLLDPKVKEGLRLLIIHVESMRDSDCYDLLEKTIISEFLDSLKNAQSSLSTADMMASINQAFETHKAPLNSIKPDFLTMIKVGWNYIMDKFQAGEAYKFVIKKDDIKEAMHIRKEGNLELADMQNYSAKDDEVQSTKGGPKGCR